jgi:hypothetical protein
VTVIAMTMTSSGRSSVCLQSLPRHYDWTSLHCGFGAANLKVSVHGRPDVSPGINMQSPITEKTATVCDELLFVDSSNVFRSNVSFSAEMEKSAVETH